MNRQARTVLAFYVCALIKADLEYNHYSDDIKVLLKCEDFVDEICEYVNRK